MKEFAEKYPLLFGIVAFAIMFLSIKFTPSGGNIRDGVQRFILSAIMILVMWPAAGKRWLKFPGNGWKFAFGLSRWFLLAEALFIGVMVGMILVAASSPEFLDVMGETADNEAIHLDSGVVGRLLAIAFLCISIGIMEELAIRRALFDMGMLQFPGLKNSALIMAVITSVLFGFIHVVTNLSSDWLAVVTAILKTVCSGAFGFIMCAIVIEGQNIWAAAAVHALNDFIPYILTAFVPGMQPGGYVTTSTSGTSAALAILPQLILLIIYIPSLIRSVKVLRKYDETNECGLA